MKKNGNKNKKNQLTSEKNQKKEAEYLVNNPNNSTHHQKEKISENQKS